MHFDLTDLRLFAAIVEAGSITAGADRSGLALAAASARVRGMETTLGAPLLERGRRGVRPTPAGLALARIKQAVHGSSSELRKALAREREGQLELLKSADGREGVRAFLERRTPVFRGE